MALEIFSLPWMKWVVVGAGKGGSLGPRRKSHASQVGRRRQQQVQEVGVVCGEMPQWVVVAVAVAAAVVVVEVVDRV